MKINSTIIKAIYRITVKNKLLRGFPRYHKVAMKRLSDLEQNYGIEELISIGEISDTLDYLYKNGDWFKAGVYVGQRLNTLDLGVLGYYLFSCKHLISAHHKLNKYQLLISDSVNFNFDVVGNHIVWNLTTPYFQKEVNNKIVQFFNDFEIAFRHRVVQDLSKKQFSPASIHVTYPFEERHLQFLTKEYDCPIYFDQKISSIHYHLNDINSFIPSSNYHIYHLTEQLLIDLLKKWYENSNYSLMTKRFIMSNMGQFNISIQAAAERFNISPRHLQRHLKNENTNYNKLLEACRKEMCIVFIQKEMLNKEIAHRLGYSDTNSFVRAFRGWFGKGIKEYKSKNK